MKSIILASHNKHKVREINEILKESNCLNTPVIHGLEYLNFYDEIPETSETIAENAVQKARYIYDLFKVDCFAEDTGLQIPGLQGEPGVRSARYAGEIRNADDNINLVLEKMKNHRDRSARFITVIALYYQNTLYTFEGICEGEITLQRSGTKGFGYDPIFKPIDATITFGQMTAPEKNQISHRKKALDKMIEFIQTNIDLFK
ncbi:MAG: RdgB/HAM1 family non-canonical purine NTP pyrophosphatase [Saprospiraceae bacterium]|nr:RdgB/HAM1 family non-canonical purine NTP pyrophosphatase [Saprospiraceae bacterium]